MSRAEHICVYIALQGAECVDLELKKQCISFTSFRISWRASVCVLRSAVGSLLFKEAMLVCVV
jgi:hypothetical protein